MDDVTLIGVDLGKRVYHLHGATEDGSVVLVMSKTLACSAQQKFATEPSGFNRRAPGVAVETAHLFVQVIQIKEAINPTEKMIGRDMRLEIELIEQSGMNLLRSKQRKPTKSP